jgi:uncharacterized protein YqgV (UPF0045/DUF77 family)
MDTIENILDGQNNGSSAEIVADRKKDKQELILERKLRALNNIDSIFILPYGTEGFKMSQMVRSADKFLSTVKRKFGITIELKEAKAVFQEFDDFAGKLWKFIYEISPNLHNVDPQDWRKINDEPGTKKIIAYRKASVVIEPRSEESGKIAMAVKIIQQRNIQVRQKSTFEELEKFVQEYVAILSAFDNLLERVAKRLKLDYKKCIE